MHDIFEAHDTTPKILIADDDPAIVRLLADRGVKMGFKVETASNGIQLLIKARQYNPDVLIVDVNMPELDGLSVCAQLLEPNCKPVEVVVVTGYSHADTVERCESMGAFYVRKGADFWKRIRAALEEIYPAMADKIGEAIALVEDTKVPEHPRVLVVDDDPDIIQFFASRLGKFGIDALYAPDAVQGYKIARKEKPAVIIADNFMPNGDAKFLLHRLRSTPVTGSIPVVVISGRKLDELTEQNLKREISGRPGAVRVLKKSFDTDELFGTLQKFCGFDKYNAEDRKPHDQAFGGGRGAARTVEANLDVQPASIEGA
jgi:CheY-like chemotaxis protein